MIGILLLLAGLVVYFVTQYDTLAIILAAFGVAILIFQLLWGIFVFSKVRKVQKRVFSDDFFSDFRKF